eukprot:jgi/Astpho2/4863/Aster-05797
MPAHSSPAPGAGRRDELQEIVVASRNGPDDLQLDRLSTLSQYHSFDSDQTANAAADAEQYNNQAEVQLQHQAPQKGASAAMQRAASVQSEAAPLLALPPASTAQAMSSTPSWPGAALLKVAINSNPTDAGNSMPKAVSPRRPASPGSPRLKLGAHRGPKGGVSDTGVAVERSADSVLNALAKAEEEAVPKADIDSDDEDAEAMQTPRQKWYLRTRRVLAAMLTLALLVAATLLKVFLPNKACLPQQQARFGTLQLKAPTHILCVAAQSVRRFEYWRWGFYFACWFPICWLTSLAIKLLVKLVESQLLAANRNILYYTASVLSATRFLLSSLQKPLVWLMRALLMLAAFVGIFLPRAENDSEVSPVYDVCVKILGCCNIFCVANLVKMLAAKQMASHFHAKTHFMKMREALKKVSEPARRGGQLGSQTCLTAPGSLNEYEYFILALSEPKQTNWSESDQHAFGRGVTEPLQSAGSGGTLYDRLLNFSVSGKLFRGQRPPSMLRQSSDMPAPSQHGDKGHSRLSMASLNVSSSGGTWYAVAPSMFGQQLHRILLDHMEGERTFGTGKGTALAGQDAAPHVQIPAAQQAPLPAHAGAEAEDHYSLVQPSAAPNSTAAEGTAADPGAPQSAAKVSKWAKVRMAHRVSGGFRAASIQASTAPDIPAINGEQMAKKIAKVEKHIRKAKLTVTLTDQLGQAKNAGGLTSDKEAKRLAFYLYWNVKPFTRDHILQDDLAQFGLSEKHAAEAFAMLDEDGDGHATLQDVRAAVQNVFRERTNLSLQLKDSKTIVGRLQFVLGAMLQALGFFIYLLIFNVDIRKTWLLFSSIVLAFAFVFGNTVKTAFESVVFLFSIHAFDVGQTFNVVDLTLHGSTLYPQIVGDVLIVDSDTHTVEEISLSTTVMRRSDGARLWYPNAKLSQNAVINISRSENKSERFKVSNIVPQLFLVDHTTPASVLEAISKAVEHHYQQHPGEFDSKKSVLFRDCSDPLKIMLAVSFTFSHCGGVANPSRRALCLQSLV